MPFRSGLLAGLRSSPGGLEFFLRTLGLLGTGFGPDCRLDLFRHLFRLESFLGFFCWPECCPGIYCGLHWLDCFRGLVASFLLCFLCSDALVFFVRTLGLLGTGFGPDCRLDLFRHLFWLGRFLGFFCWPERCPGIYCDFHRLGCFRGLVANFLHSFLGRSVLGSFVRTFGFFGTGFGLGCFHGLRCLGPFVRTFFDTDFGLG